MGKIAFVFAGQGAQYSGMGKSLYEASQAVKNLYDTAENIRKGTMAQSFEGSPDDLKKTENTQPCLFLADLAAAVALDEAGIKADGVAGFSLGEIAALAFAKTYSYEDGFKIVCERGKLMGAASSAEETAMCAVLKLEREDVINLAAKYDRLYAVNYNCPKQTVVSGLKSSIDEFSKEVSEKGGRCVPLATSGAFHSPFMSEAAEKFAEYLKNFTLNTPSIPVYSNPTAKPYEGEVIDTLGKQMCSPVKWEDTVRNMIADGFDTFIEVGAGKTLSGLIKKTSSEVKVYNVDTADDLAATVKAVKENA